MYVPSPEVVQLYEREFDAACSPLMQDSYVYSLDSEDYYFNVTNGLWPLAELPAGDEPATVLDIGVGKSTYLKEAMDASPGLNRSIRPIGITAVKHHPEVAGISYVYGDIQRPATWVPTGVLKPESVDLAVSSLTFNLLPDPLMALQNTMELLKKGGHLFVDLIPLPLDPNTSDAVTEVLKEYVRANSCRLRGRITKANPSGPDRSPVLRLHGHFQKNTGNDILSRLTSIPGDDIHAPIAYTLS